MRASCLALPGFAIEQNTQDSGSHDECCQRASPVQRLPLLGIREERYSGVEFELEPKEWEKYDSLRNGERF